MKCGVIETAYYVLRRLSYEIIHTGISVEPGRGSVLTLQT